MQATPVSLKLQPLVRETAAQFPDRLAIQFRNRCLSYRELTNALDALGQKLGSLAERRILLLLPDGIPAYLCHLHFFLSGAVVVPVTIQVTAAKLKTLCDRVRPHFVVTNALLKARNATALTDIPCLVVKSENAESPCGFDFDASGIENLPEIQATISANDSNDVRLIVFTSGSTGEPKGVCLGESTILAAAGMNVSFLGLNSSRKSLATVPLYDYYGFIQIYSHLLAQTGCILGESIAFPDSIFQKIKDEQVTDLVLVPHTLRELLRLATGERQEILKSLQVMTSSSDALTPELLQQAFAINPALKIFNIYGLTEAGRACFRKIEANSPSSSSIGRPSPGVEMVLEAPQGEPGEIIIRGPNVMRGYFQGIENDRVVFKPCTEMRTGDLGHYDERGEIVLLGRRDHMFNIKGAKIHPAEIERIALQASGVAEAQARKSTDTNGEVYILLDVVTSNGACDLEQVRTHMRKNLPPLFFPREINLVSGLNRTELGSKIIRRD